MTDTQSFARYPSLRDVVVVVTGGASGIGAAMVEEFALQQARIAFVDVSEDCGRSLVQRLASRNLAPPEFFPCDLTRIEDLRSTMARIEAQHGGIRVLVNNAANDDRHPFAEVTPEYWDDRMNVNLRHHFFAIQAVAAGMARRGGGSIINMSSISWMIPSTGLPAYVTAKAGIVGLTRTLARELGSSNIRVNSISPGAIMTERQRRLWITPEYLERVLRNQALKRELVPQDVARLVLFLASDDSSAITGQNFVIDGGWV
jgi:NAD(P)-dependent dehydrogenase (short-subunit alcohol dehydrogenase family)